MSQSNDSGLNLDHLEALAREYIALDESNEPKNSEMNAIQRKLNSQLYPAAVLELIALARRAALANQPAPIPEIKGWGPGTTYEVTKVVKQPAPTVLAGDALLPRELIERVADRLSKAQIFPLASELRTALAHQPAQEQAEPTAIYQVATDKGFAWSDVEREIYDQYTGSEYRRRIVYTAQQGPDISSCQPSPIPPSSDVAPPQKDTP